MEIKKQTNLRGELTVPGDKSISHRAVMFGSLAKGTTRISHFLEGADCLSTIACFRKMGIGIERNASEILIHGKGLHGLSAPDGILDVGNSGTTTRLISGILAGQNFTSELDAAWYAGLYQKDGLKGGHIILLNPEGSEYYEETKRQALEALRAYPQGMQIGGGITADNAAGYLEAGASHVIVTSYVFRDGRFQKENLEKLVAAVTKEKIVLDLSCRKKDGKYFVVTDRWQKFTEVALSPQILDELAEYCDEFLIHGVDVEGKGAGMDDGLVRMLGEWDGIPVTYAGGIGSPEDLERFEKESRGKIDFTIGSALDLFGGKIPYEYCKTVNNVNKP